MIVLPVALDGIPTQDPQATASALLSLAGKQWDGRPTRSGHFVLTNGDSLGWRLLDVSLRSAMRRGLSHTQLALKIETMWLDEDDMARSGKAKPG
jgi:hypothetical protein